MANIMTLAELRSAVRQRADMEDSEFVTDAELNSYINNSYTELYDLLVKVNEDYYTISESFTLSGGNNIFELPTDFYKIRGLDYALDSSSNEYIALRPFNFNERNARNRSVSSIYYGQDDLRYRIVGSDLHVVPADRSNGSYQLWYVPRPSELTTDASTADGVSGWLEYVIVDAAIKCMQKEESDVSVLFAQKQALLQRIENMAPNRDQGSPETIRDTSIMGYDIDYFYWDN